MSHYVDILVFAVAGAFFPLLMILMGIALRRRYPDPDKQMAYESGEIPFGEARVKYRIHWYVFALAFLVFDVESVFLYPWAVVYQHLSRGAALLEMAAFIIMLIIGLVYAVRKKVLTWV